MSDPVRQFRVATNVQMGNGCSANLLATVRAAGGRRVTVVTDPGVRATGMVERIIEPVKAAGIAVDIDDAVKPNPRDVDCDTGAARAKEHGSNLVVAIGGGSPIDQAKAIAMLVTNGGVALDWQMKRPFEVDPLPLIAIPTTAGTGSEVTRVSVVTDTGRMFKMTMGDPRMAPIVAYIDPALTVSVPKGTTAATSALPKAIPAIVLAYIIPSRAARLPPSSTAGTRCFAIIRIARSARPSETGLWTVQVYASIACVRASIPVAAVVPFGTETVRAGST